MSERDCILRFLGDWAGWLRGQLASAEREYRREPSGSLRLHCTRIRWLIGALEDQIAEILEN